MTMSNKLGGSGSLASPETVIVVGSGVVGLACAHYLTAAGLKVTVVDKGSIANGCSHANCGYVSPSHVLPLTEPSAIGLAIKSLFNPRSPFRVKPSLSLAQWKWFWQFTRRCTERQMLTAGAQLKSILDSSMAEYIHLMDQEKFACEWKTNGLLFVLQSERGMESFARTDDFLTEHFGLAAQRIEGHQLPAFDASLKSGLEGAYYYDDDASVRPDLLNQKWAERLRDRGVRFREQCEVKEIKRDGSRIACLKTDDIDLEADRYVFATGAWSPMLGKGLRCHIPIQPGKGYSVTMSKPDPCPKYPMLFPEHKVGVSPFDHGYRLGSMMEFCGYDESIPSWRIDQLKRSAEPYLVAPHTDGPQQEWFGWRPMTWDSLPIIGQVPSTPNAFLAAGHNMLGLSLAAATGKLIAEMIQGRPTHIDAASFSPDRF